MSRCPIFGEPKELSEVILPTYENVMKYYLLVRYQLKPTAATKEPTVVEISEVVSANIERLWLKASIPVCSHTRVLQMIRTYHDKYMKLMKNIKRKTSMQKLESFRANARTNLFDIAACKCAFEACHCDKVRKIPVAEQQFLIDQRNLRMMCMGGVDKLASRQLTKKQLRKLQDRSRFSKYGTANVQKRSYDSNEQNVCDETVELSDDSDKTDNQWDSEEYDDCIDSKKIIPQGQFASNKKQNTSTKHNKLKLPALARACDRHGLSDRTAAAVATAVLEDLGVVTTHDLSNVIDTSKIRRARKRKRNELQRSQKNQVVRAIFFDGRKDKTLICNRAGGRLHRQTITEEHISLIREPESSYLGHLTPTAGTAVEIKNSIVKFIASNNIDIEQLVAIGCDGTNVNTGRVGGVIRLLEIEYEKPLQWLVCMLHANELPLRHLLQTLDGSTSGPRAFSGTLGKALSTCEILPVVAFEKIPTDMPCVTSDDLSTDQRYLWEICHAVSNGQCSLALSTRNPGTMSHSRWLTTANRLLRLYIATDLPSPHLVTLVTYVMRVYAPSWFRIKMKPSCTYGTKHLFHTIQSSRYLSKELRDIVDPVIERNSFFAHPENVLLAMITDERKYIRELGMRRILKVRMTKSTHCTVIRQFVTPKLNFDAHEYYEMLDWTTVQVSEPPLTTDISEADMRLYVKTGGDTTLEFPRFPCHTQAVERCVKIVTDASLSVCGPESRDGFIRALLESRRIMPIFNTKSQYKVQSVE